MILTLKIVICVLSVLTAIGLFCALVGLALMRKFLMGLRCDPHSDPFSTPFGDMPGFTAEQLSEIAPAVGKDDPLRRSFDLSRPNSAGLALRSDADGAGRPSAHGLPPSACFSSEAAMRNALAGLANLSQKSAGMILRGQSSPRLNNLQALERAVVAEELRLRDYLLSIHPLVEGTGGRTA